MARGRSLGGILALLAPAGALAGWMVAAAAAVVIVRRHCDLVSLLLSRGVARYNRGKCRMRLMQDGCLRSELGEMESRRVLSRL